MALSDRKRFAHEKWESYLTCRLDVRNVHLQRTYVVDGTFRWRIIVDQFTEEGAIYTDYVTCGTLVHFFRAMREFNQQIRWAVYGADVYGGKQCMSTPK